MTDCHSQYVKEEVAEMPLKKHIIATHINPLIGVLTSNGVNNVKLGITYKRQIADNKRLRIQASYLPSENLDLGGSISSSNVYVGYQDDTIQYLVSRFSGQRTYLFGMGAEIGNYTSKIGAYYGADLLMGIGRSFDYENVRIGKLDTTYSVYNVYLNDTVQRNIYAPDSSYFTPTYRQNILSFGLALTVGCRINLGKRFELSGHLSPQLMRSRSRYYRWENGLKQSTPSYYIDWDLELRLLEVMFAYKF